GNLLAQPREVGRENGRGDADGLLHAESLTLCRSRGKEAAATYPPLRRVKRAMKKPSAPPCSSHRPGRVRTQPPGVSTSGGSSPASTGRRRKSGRAARKAATTSSPSSGSSEQTE